MIFCTVGTQLPFDRLIDYLLAWQVDSKCTDLVCQVGSSNKYLPKDGFQVSISEPFFSGYFDSAKIIVSHAGMGNIIRALDAGKAIVVVPRLASLGEHINNHQLDTVQSLSVLPNIFVASTYEEFIVAVDSALSYEGSSLGSNSNLQQLIRSVSEFVAS